MTPVRRKPPGWRRTACPFGSRRFQSLWGNRWFGPWYPEGRPHRSTIRWRRSARCRSPRGRSMQTAGSCPYQRLSSTPRAGCLGRWLEDPDCRLQSFRGRPVSTPGRCPLGRRAWSSRRHWIFLVRTTSERCPRSPCRCHRHLRRNWWVSRQQSRRGAATSSVCLTMRWRMCSDAFGWRKSLNGRVTACGWRSTICWNSSCGLASAATKNGGLGSPPRLRQERLNQRAQDAVRSRRLPHRPADCIRMTVAERSSMDPARIKRT